MLVSQQGRIAHLTKSNRFALASLEKERAIRQRLERDIQKLSAAQPQAETIARLTAENARLRNEATTARRGVQRGNNVTSAPPAATAATALATNFPIPIVSFTAQSSAEMQPGQTIVTGGWPGENGSRSFMFLTYQPAASQADAVALAASIYDVSGDQANALGLADFRADADGNTPSALLDLDPEAKAQWLASLKNTDGVRLTSSPSVTTMVGRQAIIFIGGKVPVGDGKFADVGRTISLLPVQGENGIKVTVKTSHTTIAPGP